MNSEGPKKGDFPLGEDGLAGSSIRSMRRSAAKRSCYCQPKESRLSRLKIARLRSVDQADFESLLGL